MNIFRGMNRRSIGWWQREHAANRSDYAVAVVAVLLVVLAIVGPVARGSL